MPRRRLAVDDRRRELLGACLTLIGSRPWDEVSMADVATAAGASKPLLYHYFPTKSDLYLAAVRAAAEQLRAATTASTADLDPRLALDRALAAHVDWVDANAQAYRAVLQGGHSSDPAVQAIIEESRADVVARLAEGFGLRRLSPAQRTALRGWVGFLEGACLDWLEHRDIPKSRLVRILAASLTAVVPTADA
ncbi:MAG: TetR/AcrR family transcriptional regulator [Actinomycetota bacterium]|nr:TetR/AcrR family transcriptional regulator [Actinomycetota bacterium]